MVGLVILITILQTSGLFLSIVHAASDTPETPQGTNKSIFSLIVEFFQSFIKFMFPKPTESSIPIGTPITQPPTTETVSKPPLTTGSSPTPPPTTKNVAVTVRWGGNTICVTLLGSSDYQSLTSLTLTATAPSRQVANSRFSSPKLGQNMTITSPGTGNIHFVVTGQFMDGTQQVILDTFLPLSNQTTIPATTTPPKTKNVTVTAMWVGNTIIATLQSGSDYQSLTSLTLTATAPSRQVASSIFVSPLPGQDMTITSPGTGKIHLVVTGQFTDGSQQVVLETFIPISNLTTIPPTIIPPESQGKISSANPGIFLF
jgi:hypothetical protein